ncbi:hypothetical protein [Algivirga pacifica]|uniref:Uncharacterized protein n=1 Tax=Algivirga pacifica TaxID=1162670 RepID=A0ABP9DJJ3_9BACT
MLDRDQQNNPKGTGMEAIAFSQYQPELTINAVGCEEGVPVTAYVELSMIVKGGLVSVLLSAPVIMDEKQRIELYISKYIILQGQESRSWSGKVDMGILEPGRYEVVIYLQEWKQGEQRPKDYQLDQVFILDAE